MARVRSRAAAVALTTVLIASSQGCGSDKSREGPPFEPANIDAPQSLLVTKADIAGVGASTPYGAVLRWWQALQLGDVRRVQRSYVKRISAREAKRQIAGLRPRTSQPLDPDVRSRNSQAAVEALVRSASPFDGKPNVVSVRDFRTHFYLVRVATKWRLRTDSFERYSRGRRHSRLAVAH
jgi:hypothetical protein